MPNFQYKGLRLKSTTDRKISHVLVATKRLGKEPRAGIITIRPARANDESEVLLVKQKDRS